MYRFFVLDSLDCALKVVTDRERSSRHITPLPMQHLVMTTFSLDSSMLAWTLVRNGYRMCSGGETDLSRSR